SSCLGIPKVVSLFVVYYALHEGCSCFGSSVAHCGSLVPMLLVFQADAQLINDTAVLALPPQPLPCTVHATVPPNSNSNSSPPVILAPVCPHSSPHLQSPSHDPVSQYHVDPSPNINHVFVEDCSDDVGYDDEEVDFDSAEKDYEGGSKFFSTLVFAATPGLSASPVVTQSTSCPPCVEAALAAVSALSTPKTPMDATVPLTATASTSPEPPPSTWHHLFKSNRDTTRDSVFHRLGPQVGNPVVDRSEASLLDDCVPPPKQGDVELVSQKEADVAAPGGWEIVNRRKLKHKPTPSQPSTVPPHTEPCSAQGAAAHMPQCDHLLPPPRLVPSTTSVPTSVIAGSRADKGKSV
ncbi:hypothetical protein H0E87_031698, partial [Populus deltoides]